MAPQHVVPGTATIEICLQHVTALREEMTVAMSAISGNAIGALEESLWKQQVLCVGLKRLLERIPGASADSECMQQIRSATQALHRVNQTYADLVRQASKHADVMHSLCRSYTTSSPHRNSNNNGSICSFEA